MKRDRYRKLNTELARPIGIVDGTSVGGTRKTRTSGPFSECIRHIPDGNGGYVSTIYRTSSTRTRKTVVDDTKQVERQQDLANKAVVRTPAEVAALCGIPAPKHDTKYDHDYNYH